MAEAALVLSIKFVQTSSDTFCLSSFQAAEPLLFTPASPSAAKSSHTVPFSTFPSVHLLKVIKVIKCTVNIFLQRNILHGFERERRQQDKCWSKKRSDESLNLEKKKNIQRIISVEFNWTHYGYYHLRAKTGFFFSPCPTSVLDHCCLHCWNVQIEEL